MRNWQRNLTSDSILVGEELVNEKLNSWEYGGLKILDPTTLYLLTDKARYGLLVLVYSSFPYCFVENLHPLLNKFSQKDAIEVEKELREHQLLAEGEDGQFIGVKTEVEIEGVKYPLPFWFFELYTRPAILPTRLNSS